MWFSPELIDSDTEVFGKDWQYLLMLGDEQEEKGIPVAAW